MSQYPSALQLSPSVCLHLLCLLLLLTDCSSTVPKKDPVPAEPPTQLNTTQANCSTACDNAGVSDNATALQLNSEGTLDDQFPPGSSSSISHTLNDSVVSSTPLNQSGGGNHPSTAPPSNQQPVLPDQQHPSPETVTQPAVPLPSTTTDSPPQPAPITSTTTSTGSSTSTTTEPVRNVYMTTLLVTPIATTTPTSTTTTTTSTAAVASTATTPTAAVASTATTPTAAVTHPATTVKATTTLKTAITTVTVPTTTGTKRSPPPPPSAAPPQPNASHTGMPPIQTSLSKEPTAPITVGTPTGRNEPVASGTRVGVVDVAGDALTRQLVDTASLLAVLLFGLLFFLVTVALFVRHAYESYRRKDYTQVDYLINGMYTDSGV